MSTVAPAAPRRRPSLRWGVPVGIAALVVGGSILGPTLAASAGADLPERTAAQLLTDLQGADVTALSGTVLVDARLGLPSLSLPGGAPSGMGGGSGTDLLSVLGGRTTVGVWASGTKARIAVHGDVGERDLVADGTQLWTWSSDSMSVTHTTLPTLGQAPSGATPPALDPAQMLTPDALSAAVLATVSPTTTVTTGANVRVAGRPAYELVLSPSEPGSLVAQVRIAIDAGERVPTRVEIISTTSATPALSVGFTSVSFTAPAESVFTFTPPAGATVTEKPLGSGSELGHGLLGGDLGGWSGVPTLPTGPLDPSATSALGAPTVVGTGWASVLVVQGVNLDAIGTAGPNAGGPAGSQDLTSLLAMLPQVSGSWGSGHLLTSALVSVLLTDDGHLLIGAVDGASLERVAATLG